MVNIKYLWYHYYVLICHCLHPDSTLCVILTLHMSIFIDLWESVLKKLQHTQHKLDLLFVPYSNNLTLKQFGLSQPLVSSNISSTFKLLHKNRTFHKQHLQMFTIFSTIL